MPIPSCVLDASALLAYLKDEPGSDIVESALRRGAAMSAANLAEVLSKVADIGEEPLQLMNRFRRRGFTGQTLEVIPLGEEDAYLIAELHGKSRPAGLSVGDRACLGLALRLGLPALTADQSWLRVRLGVKVEAIG